MGGAHKSFFEIDDINGTRAQVHAALPACLAARYPRFLRADGIWDPRYAAKDRSIYKYPEDWPASEEDGDHLRAVFREVSLDHFLDDMSPKSFPGYPRIELGICESTGGGRETPAACRVG